MSPELPELPKYMTRGNGATVNCYDQAGAVCTIARLIGIPACYKFLQPFGYIPTLNLVGRGNCNNPFYLSYTPNLNKVAGSNSTRFTVGDRRDPFGNHAFVECATTGGGAKTRIYDACAGPSSGTHAFSDYYTNSHDASTPDEAADASSDPGSDLQGGAVSELE